MHQQSGTSRDKRSSHGCAGPGGIQPTGSAGEDVDTRSDQIRFGLIVLPGEAAPGKTGRSVASAVISPHGDDIFSSGGNGECGGWSWLQKAGSRAYDATGRKPEVIGAILDAFRYQCKGPDAGRQIEIAVSR